MAKCKALTGSEVKGLIHTLPTISYHGTVSNIKIGCHALIMPETWF